MLMIIPTLLRQGFGGLSLYKLLMILIIRLRPPKADYGGLFTMYSSRKAGLLLM